MYRVAVVGIDRVAVELLSVLGHRDFPIEDLIMFGSSDDAGKHITYEEEKLLTVKDIDKYDFDNNYFDFVFFCSSADVSKKYAEQIAQRGSIVIDSSSAFSEDPQVPLIIPEVNLQELPEYRTKGIVSSPNSLTTMLLLGLWKLHENYGVRRVVMSSYQAIAEKGEKALNELFEQTRGIYTNQFLLKTQENFTKQISFNVIPHVGDFDVGEQTTTENSIIKETKRILHNEISISAHCAYVPVFIGHSISANIEFESHLSKSDIKSLLQKQEYLGIVDYEANEGYVTPVESLGEDKLYISRIRADNSLDNTFNMWLVGDNLRVGITLNMVKIAEEIINFL